MVVVTDAYAAGVALGIADDARGAEAAIALGMRMAVDPDRRLALRDESIEVDGERWFERIPRDFRDYRPRRRRVMGDDDGRSVVQLGRRCGNEFEIREMFGAKTPGREAADIAISLSKSGKPVDVDALPASAIERLGVQKRA